MENKEELVQHKFGGPVMTVISHEDGRVYCVWWNDTLDKAEYADFSESAVVQA